ncbi:phage integrase [Klebsiella variicola]|nr:phage integrase [Klebsiella variicola]
MGRITRLLTNNEILKAKPREKGFTLHDGDGLFLLFKPPVKNSSVSVINDREAAAAQI